MLLTKTGGRLTGQASISAVAASGIAFATAAPGAHNAVPVAADLLLARLLVVIFATICLTIVFLAIVGQLVQNL